jgi:hypothetical protein
MPGSDDKRFYRDLKRKIKKAGTKKRRRAEKRELSDNPTEAHWTEYEYGRNSSEWLNGMDEDKTREHKGDRRRHTDRGESDRT